MILNSRWCGDGEGFCRFFAHRELSEVFTFVRVLPGRLASPAQFVVEPHEQVPDGLGAGDDVERRRQRAALVEVAHPQLGAGELPLDVGVVLQDEKKTAKLLKLRGHGTAWEVNLVKPLKRHNSTKILRYPEVEQSSTVVFVFSEVSSYSQILDCTLTAKTQACYCFSKIKTLQMKW